MPHGGYRGPRVVPAQVLRALGRIGTLAVCRPAHLGFLTLDVLSSSGRCSSEPPRHVSAECAEIASRTSEADASIGSHQVLCCIPHAEAHQHLTGAIHERSRPLVTRERMHGKEPRVSGAQRCDPFEIPRIGGAAQQQVEPRCSELLLQRRRTAVAPERTDGEPIPRLGSRAQARRALGYSRARPVPNPELGDETERRRAQPFR